MKRILWMVLVNLWYVPFGLYQLIKMSSHPERYSVEDRYKLVKKIDNHAVKGGRVDLDVTGLEYVPQENGYVIYPNHQGMFDALALIQVLDQPTSIVMKKELANIPFLKQIFACVDAISLDRDDPREGMKVILKVTEEVKKGRNYIIFAEGTRSKMGNKLLDFKGGSFKCAMKAKCPVVPVALIDSYKAFDTGSLKKTKVGVHFLPPIMPEEYEGMKTNELAALVKSRIEAKIAEYEVQE